MTRNFEATSARGVVSSKRCFSNVQYTAAAKTLVGVRSSNLSNAECDGSGKMAILQSCIHFAGEFAYNWVARDTHPYLSAVGVTPQFLKISP